MKISCISFGKKIPITQCKVFDKDAKTFVEATFYEYDCKDLFDVYDVEELEGNWSFKNLIKAGMQNKYLNQIIGKKDSTHYYCTKDKNGRTIGICKTNETNDAIEVKLITNGCSDKYKYVGQTMLTSLAQIALISQKEKLIIKRALADAKDFYGKICGFHCTTKGQNIFGYDYELKKEELPTFININNSNK